MKSSNVICSNKRFTFEQKQTQTLRISLVHITMDLFIKKNEQSLTNAQYFYFLLLSVYPIEGPRAGLYPVCIYLILKLLENNGNTIFEAIDFLLFFTSFLDCVSSPNCSRSKLSCLGQSAQHNKYSNPTRGNTVKKRGIRDSLGPHSTV